MNRPYTDYLFVIKGIELDSGLPLPIVPGDGKCCFYFWFIVSTLCKLILFMSY